MDKIWYRNPSKSEVIGRCGGDEKPELPRRTDKSRKLKNNKKYFFFTVFAYLWIHYLSQLTLQKNFPSMPFGCHYSWENVMCLNTVMCSYIRQQKSY